MEQEQEVDALKQKIAELEEKLARQEEDGFNSDSHASLPSVSEPKIFKKQLYEYVEGWKLLDLKIMNEALEIAQKCGHSQVVLVEANRDKVRVDLVSQLAYVCIICGRQTVFSTSSYCKKDPSNYEVNKSFASLGKTFYTALVTKVTNDKTVIVVPQDKKLSDKTPEFFFKSEEFNENSRAEDVEGVVNFLEVDVKCEPKEEPEDYIEDYLEPSISITEGDEDNDDQDITDTEHAVKQEEDVEPNFGPQIDVSTITTNTPNLALATVKPQTQVMGGMVTPWPLHVQIFIHPSLFIRTTCSKIFLPPGLYNYQRNNGLKSIMSVKSDSGTFDSIENYYHMTKINDEVEKTRGKKVDNIRWNTKVKKTYTSAHRKTPLQIYSQDCKNMLANEGVPKCDWDKLTIERWAALPPEEKQEYNKRATLPNGQPAELEPVKEEKKKKVNVPLPALKKFAIVVAPGLKKKKPFLAKVENRGQLNKHILEQWMLLSVAEQYYYKSLAGMVGEADEAATATPSTKPTSSSKPEAKTNAGKITKQKLKKDSDDSDEEYSPRRKKKK